MFWFHSSPNVFVWDQTNWKNNIVKGEDHRLMTIYSLAVVVVVETMTTVFTNAIQILIHITKRFEIMSNEIKMSKYNLDEFSPEQPSWTPVHLYSIYKIDAKGRMKRKYIGRKRAAISLQLMGYFLMFSFYRVYVSRTFVIINVRRWYIGYRPESNMELTIKLKNMKSNGKSISNKSLVSFIS